MGLARLSSLSAWCVFFFGDPTMASKAHLAIAIALCFLVSLCIAMPIEKKQMPPVSCNQPGEWVKSPWDKCNLCFCDPNEVSTICTQNHCSSRRRGRGRRLFEDELTERGARRRRLQAIAQQY